MAFTMGVGFTSPADAAIITTITPILTMILAAFILREMITGKKITGVCASAVGAVLLVSSSEHAFMGTVSGYKEIGDEGIRIFLSALPRGNTRSATVSTRNVRHVSAPYRPSLKPCTLRNSANTKSTLPYLSPAGA